MTEGAEIYASDEAWEHWFEKCAVKRCSLAEQRRLSKQIESAFFREVGRHSGMTRGDYEREDVCDLFDQHFYLHGDVDNPKALKAYYMDRIDASDPNGMKKIICGTFFSPNCGRIKTIVLETIPLVKGWRARWKNTPEGKMLIWERPPELEDEDEPRQKEPVCYRDAGVALDNRKSVWRRIAIGLLDFLEAESENDVSEVAILVYAVVNGVSASSLKLQRLLGVKQVQCYNKMKRMREKMRCRLIKDDVMSTDAPLIFALRDEVLRRIEPSVLESLKTEVGEEYR